MTIAPSTAITNRCAPPSQSQHIDTNASPAIFPGTLSECEEEEDTMNPITLIVTIEEATIEGCSRDEEIFLVAHDLRQYMMTGMCLTIESPIKSLHSKVTSITLLHPYAQSTLKVGPVQIGQNIAPWSTLNASISPSKPSPATPATVRAKSGDHDVPTLCLSHKHTPTPAPATDPLLMFRALRPATRKIPKAGRTVHPAHAPSDDDEDPNDADD
ncbi:hypothetical protein SCLCIDRAFT_24617 [Scleroderma citrinum Foug A]|uniref:Uncharacterized protein n=1 Tax=Scleroderma citrinum Foug A TaxID=1036808 RepID=A0A0C3ADP4_9AGAM|nr:hypothetical protein SCLCIDRAFT_24617 [Scleroderma citrinum Foug A]